jgi:hypothetical protein
MLSRTLSTHKDAYIYANKGVTVCKRWRESFLAFLEDMGKRPSSKHSLDRYPNRTGNYEPGNCRWATASQQNRNYSRNRFITVHGKTMTLVEWSELTGIKREAIADRLNRGWEPERAVSPTQERHYRDQNGRLRDSRGSFAKAS